MPTQIPSKLSIPQVLSNISKPFNPKMVALVNGTTEFRIAKIKGDFIWHSPPGTDELFYILDGGPLVMKVRERRDDGMSERELVLEKGELFVVPKGVQHLPGADNEVSVMVAEMAGELNTGDQGF
ncbi:hypothetical protein K469DRAFT_674219 [Zopfia rhizophila CBS 207.26]|uniref:Cupin type-1 domain-containing protein n=1 Tax=Zopfia rhizophila CBS 207.26 TaxID=1314779 RepID=A0A6A6DIS4_9PEZI|nr:hypothetical protein K469DRAFT_674219 [Zopfia rhizophila CBS 207.26]